MKPLVSVIIPNYNYSQYIGEAVGSVLSQTYAPIEVIVVDDGSSDDSLKVLKGFGEKITVLSQQNAGVSAARNLGAGESSGEFLAFLDADDSWYPTKIEKQIERFKVDAGIGLVHVGVRDVDGGGNELKVRLGGLEGDVSDELLRFETEDVILGGGSGIMIPRSVFDEVEGFDTRLSTSADWDLFYRIASRRKVGFVAAPLLAYRYHGSNMHGKVGVMEHDMLLGYEKAFSDGAKVRKRYAYGNLYKNLAGSFFVAGRYRDFARNAILSLWNRPSHIGYFLAFPLRRLRK